MYLSYIRVAFAGAPIRGVYAVDLDVDMESEAHTGKPGRFEPRPPALAKERGPAGFWCLL